MGHWERLGRRAFQEDQACRVRVLLLAEALPRVARQARGGGESTPAVESAGSSGLDPELRWRISSGAGGESSEAIGSLVGRGFVWGKRRRGAAVNSDGR